MSKDYEKLWAEGEHDDIMNAVAPARREVLKAKDEDHRSAGNFIGCPIWWLQCVSPVVNSKDQLIVALYLWRRRVVCGNRGTFDVPNGELLSLGISRKVKYRTLDLLAAAGVIRIDRRSTLAVPTITILAKKKTGLTLWPKLGTGGMAQA